MWAFAVRGQGIGHRLLTKFIRRYEKTLIILVVGPFDSSPLSIDALTAWYERHGFVMASDRTGWMERLPHVCTSGVQHRDDIKGRRSASL